jgi:hypothetical protein
MPVLPKSPASARDVMPRAALTISCAAPTHRIDARIFGVAYYPLTAAKDGHVWQLRPGARRWGGNHTTRYNWRLGNAWNTGADWFFRNVDFIGQPGYSWRDFLTENRAHGVSAALTLPTIGWVAKDTTSPAFPVSRFGPQRSTDPHHPNAGDGVGFDGRKVSGGPPELTSVRMPPADIGEWVRAIRAFDAGQGSRSVSLYLLDNEPHLWHENHRDVHPEPLGYDELLERTVAYATAVRHADPDAVIAGPSAWGWPAYFFSGKDAAAGFWKKPDRRAHGDVPLLDWYLTKLREHERKTGVRLLDVLNVHFYPQDLPREAVDPASRERRLRSTRALWDPTYKDESWIDDTVELLPRLSRLIAERYPGLGLMIGEYNFGGDNDISGALATAEVLGRFSQHAGLNAAFLWTYPPAGSPAFHAFRAYRDYDGQGSALPPLALATRTAEGLSLFAAKSETSERVVAVAINLSPQAKRTARVTVDGCGAPAAVRAFQLTEKTSSLVSVPALIEGGKVAASLPPYSVTVFEITMKPSRLRAME